MGVAGLDLRNMDLRTSGDGGEVPKGEKSGHQEGELGSKLKGAGSVSDRNMAGKSPSRDMIFRADKIDLKSLDVQLEKHLSRVWSRSVEHQVQRPKEAWEIDPSKLEIRYLIAQGTYGTVYRGTYETQDVAGITQLTALSLLVLCYAVSYCCMDIVIE